MLAILGVDPLDEHWTQSGGDTETAMEALDVLVRADLDRRQQARTEKNWAGADGVRARPTKARIEVTATTDGPGWSIKCGWEAWEGPPTRPAQSLRGGHTG